MGCVLLHGSRPSQGRTALLNALRLNPLDRSNAGFAQMIPNTYYFEGNYLGAVDASRHAIISYPGFPQPYRWLAAALGQLGLRQEAATALRQAVEASPSSFDFFTRQRPPWYRAEDHAHMLLGLRRAGWQG
jgi:tetratricopeptide (TPR) repeat protein